MDFKQLRAFLTVSDTGNVTRHRGFFIIDRSIPVGFVPGSRLNTDDCILVRRLIE